MTSRRKQLELTFRESPAQLMSPDEIFESADAELLKTLVEDRRLERKRTSLSGRSLGDNICMWANTPPDGGVIVWGLDDHGEFEGCNHLSPQQLNAAETVSSVYCPDARVRTRRVPVTNKKGAPDFVLLIRVAYNPDFVVRTVSDDVFIRRGDSKCKLRPEEVRELQADKGEIQLEQRDCGLNWPDDFDMTAIQEFLAEVREKRDIPPDRTDTEVLTLRRLGRNVQGVFRPNFACLLLFANDPLSAIPGCKVRFQRFEGEREGTGASYNAVKDLILEGRVPSLIHQVEQILDAQLRTFSPLNSRGKFFPVPEYPKAAWYETVVNACVHRSYGNGLKNMPTFIKMYDDRLVIESPGPFPPLVTPKNIYDMHHPRNPTLMDAMFYMKYVRCAHEGTRRIRDTMTEMGLPEPEFAQSEVEHSIVRVVLRNNIKQRRVWIDRDVARLVSEAIAADLSEDEKRVLNWTAEHEKLTISDAQKLLNFSWQRARKLLIDLASKRVLQYIRFKPYETNTRDPKAYFRLRSNRPLPPDAYEQTSFE